MPRSNRPRGRRVPDEVPELDLSRALAGVRRTETKRDGVWNVQPITAAAAVKDYVCPGCSLTIAPGVAHLVTWRADGLMGEADDLAARRHWHSHCWKIRS
ncbi:hypothetical protein M2152_001578 [Microbacteriaceae bacterium SG_E_30_P1]|uniref:ATP/GTP-binding protein n=1 Tax=Antiquaquibacter oligotrophicus TaxID=2880260 RepID=A0ABT6KN17_9MICO|nr:hypothetical protein [Antiquaquibacter oligotrophicus]MDH6181396.1 hypothetical protein [Antiquaquibacter oligotrophicus]UDF12912.1 hypothetical protein LH407_12225 [Antiquaquibacter oligotrophicus]